MGFNSGFKGLNLMKDNNYKLSGREFAGTERQGCMLSVTFIG
jgi:hypothetical protein